MRERLARLRRTLEALFPERHLYVRSGGRMRAYVLSPRRQLLAASGIAATALWTGVASAALLLHALSGSFADREVARTQARLRSSVAELNAEGATSNQLAASLEKRHAALAMLLTGLNDAPGAAQTLIPIIGQGLAGQDVSPAERMQKLELGQQQLLDAADSYARSRADRLRLAFHLTGVAPDAYLPKAGGLGGPLVEPKDPGALAALLGVDADFAGRVQHAEHDLWDARELAQAAQALPLAPPTAEPARSSGFGVRIDPFTHRPAFHTGLDFPGGRMTPVYATGPGVVAYIGPRSGYGKVVEVDHGGGLKTRYAHLQTIAVHAGEPVAPGERLGGMGSTGRSTGPHLHYEVWLNGRPVNPERFLKAGAYVNAAG